MFYLHLCAVGEVSSWDSMLLLDLGENHRKLVDQVVLLAFFAENGWHLLLQIADDVCMSLSREKSRHKITTKGRAFVYAVLELKFSP